MRHPVLKFVSFSFLLLLLLLSIGCRDLLTQHNIDLDGTMHGKKLYNGAKNCTSCHGIELDGNAFIPGCYECHGPLWSTDDHRTNFGGVMHYMAVSTFSTCSECHGTKLLGKRNRPSCYACHEDNWTNYPFHTVYEDGYAHAPGHENPLTSCTRCHGAALTGGTAQSCYNCHGNEWDGEGGND